MYTIRKTKAPSSLARLSRVGTFRLFGYDSLIYLGRTKEYLGDFKNHEVVTEPHVELHDNELNQCALVMLIVHSVDLFRIYCLCSKPLTFKQKLFTLEKKKKKLYM